MIPVIVILLMTVSRIVLVNGVALTMIRVVVVEYMISYQLMAVMMCVVLP